MLENFYPDRYQQCATDIDWESYYDEGIRGVIFDIDNTLVPHNAPVTQDVVAFFAKLHKMGLNTCLISNNRMPRVQPFADAVKSAYICKAKKPSPGSYLRAMELMGTKRENTLLVGDQIFTDILGAKRIGIQTILVQRIGKKEDLHILFKRILEKFILWRWRRQKHHMS